MSSDNNDSSEPSPQKMESGQEAAQTLFRNSSFYLAADGIIKLLGFVFNIYVVRELGDEQFGLFSTALAYAGIFSIIADLGMTQFATREIARGRRTADTLFWDLVVVRLLLSVVATVLITSSAYVVAGYQPTMVVGIFLVCLSFFFHAFFGPVRVILIGNVRVDYASLLNTLIQVFFVSVGTWVLVSGQSFYGLIVATYVGVPAAAVLGAIIIRRLKFATLKFKINPGTWADLFRHSLPFAVITFTLVAATDLDTVLLSLWRSPEEVGWYKAAYNLIFKLLFIKTALLSTLGPQMSRYYGVSTNRVGTTFNAGFKVLWAFSLPIAVGSSMLSTEIIDWLYGDQYANSAIILAILIWALPLLNLSSLCGQVTTATDKEKKAMRIYIGAALLNLVSNIIAIPIWGYVGAAASTIITEAVALIFFYKILHTEFPLTDLKNTIFKPLLAGLLMAVVVMLVSGWHVGFVILIGATVYGITLLALKPFNQMETDIIKSFWLSIQRKLGWGATTG